MFQLTLERTKNTLTTLAGPAVGGFTENRARLVPEATIKPMKEYETLPPDPLNDRPRAVALMSPARGTHGKPYRR